MKRIVILLLAGAVCACARSSKSGESTTPQVRVDNDIIAVAPGSPVLERLTTGKVTATPYRATFTTSGMVQAIPARYAVAHVKEKYIRLIQRLSEVEVRLTAMPDVPVKGTVYHISELLDPETRSVEVLIECDNRDHRMKPYMYGTVQLTDAVTEAMLVPTSAILQQEESCYVLVCEGANRFRKAEVTTASTDGDRTVVLSGVRPGEEIVTGGAFYLLDAR